MNAELDQYCIGGAEVKHSNLIGCDQARTLFIGAKLVLTLTTCLSVCARCCFKLGLHFRVDDNIDKIAADNIDLEDLFKAVNNTRRQRMATYTTSDDNMYWPICKRYVQRF